ncbi:MAG: protein kinase, partial [Anaerolineales bacterium]
MTDWVGQTLSKVRIEKRIARGGMAEVYSGRHTTLNRACVVKILYAHLSEDPRLITRFHTEAQAVAALRHSNIVQVFDFDVFDARPYIVMELLEGITLETHLLNLRD